MKALLLADWGKPLYPGLRRKFPGITFVEAYTPDDVLKGITDADIVFGYVDSKQFASAKKLKWIQTLDAGMEGLFRRVPEVEEANVTVTNARGAGAPMIGEHIVAMILAFARGFPQFEELKRKHKWDQDFGLSIVQMVQGKTAGFIGFGKSGKEGAWRCKAMGMKVLAVDKHPVDGDPIVDFVWSLDRLPDLLRQSDYVVITVPYSPANENMIGAKELGLMKKGARLIVTSRGRIVEHKALVNALKSGAIAGAGLDVVIQEPLPADNELWDLPNVMITPHISGNAMELDQRTYDIFEENLGRYLAGQPLINQVDKHLRY